MSRFLPPGGPYGVAKPNADGFTHEGADLLQRIGDKMEVRRAATPGRIPSPVSRAYMFYANLFQNSIGAPSDGEDSENGVEATAGRQKLQEDARHTLRGLLATFALREVLDLSITPKEVPLRESRDTPVSSVLVPTLDATPGGQEMWNPMRFYTVHSKGKEEVLAGHSPLTGIYPSATPPKELTGLYWYDHKAGRWYDPTGSTFDEEGRMHVSRATSRRTKQLIKAWLDHVLADVSQSNLQDAGIEMEAHDARSMMKEMQTWQRELANVQVPESVSVDAHPLSTDSALVSFPFLNAAVIASNEHIWSDLPMHEGRLIVTKKHLRSDTIRIYGRVFGTHQLDGIMSQLPGTGDNLGQALNMGEAAIPMPFLFIDRLFTPNLTIITSADKGEGSPSGLSQEWSGLEVESLGTTEYYFVPMDPKILEIIDADDLLDLLSAEPADDGQNYRVKLEFENMTINKYYYSNRGDGEHRLDPKIQRDQFDLRLFPNYDLDAVRDLISESAPDDSESDFKYYARVRIHPDWHVEQDWGLGDVTPFTVNGGKVQEVYSGEKSYTLGSEERGGKAIFYTMNERPQGFSVPERGFCLLDLESPSEDREALNPDEWTVGVDFGTSNTCVARESAGNEGAEILTFPVMTTSLLASPRYDVPESTSAVLDFFTKFGGEHTELMSQTYFPTQVITQQEKVRYTEKMDLRNGIIYFDNVGMAGPSITSMVHGFPERERASQKFHLKQNIKWDNDEWLIIFMQHLRKQVLLTAAKENAIVKSVRFSYPKSFSYRRTKNFRRALQDTWGIELDMDQDMVSESEASRDYVVQGFGQHIIVDIGGGTTDIIAFHSQKPVFQTSFELAGGYINDYVLRSTSFREKIGSFLLDNHESRAQKIGALDAFKAKEDITPGGLLQVWFGILQSMSGDGKSAEKSITSEVFDAMRKRTDEDKKRDAAEGFFLSNVILFCGIFYYAGQLLREVADGNLGHNSFTISEVKFTLTGNGSKLITSLEDDSHPFDTVLRAMLLRGLRVSEEDIASRKVKADLEYVVDSNGEKIDPKAAVAFGLSESKEVEEVEDIPVTNIVGEQGYVVDGEETNLCSPLIDFYREVKKDIGSFEPPTSPPENFNRFFECLEEVLPYGENEELDVVPEMHEAWATDLRDRLYPTATHRIRDRVRAEASEIGDLDKLGRRQPALESLFVIELAGFLEAIREEYAV